MRGEKNPDRIAYAMKQGSPPHARGKGQASKQAGDNRGITPACAGKSKTSTVTILTLWDHPRMRGEKALIRGVDAVREGSPPHARGKGLNTFLILCVLAQTTYLHRNFV